VSGSRIGLPDSVRACLFDLDGVRSEFFSHHHDRVVLVHSTRSSGLRMAAGMDHIVEGPHAPHVTVESGEDLGRVTVACELERDHADSLAFTPRLPQRLSRLAFRLLFRGRPIRVGIDHRQTRCAPLDVAHHGATVTLAPDKPVTRPIPPASVRGPPNQPPGREPAPRRPPSPETGKSPDGDRS
jgi:hypothetical protein